MILPLDHVGIFGSDINVMVDAYRSLGFQVTEPERLDAGGRADQGRQYSAHVMFDQTYIELTAVEDCQPEHHLAPYLRLPGGIRILILQSDAAEGERVRIEALGLPTSPLYTAERRLTYGNRQTARFCWFALDPQPLDQLLIGWVQHLTRDAVFYRNQAHDNTATNITGLHFNACDFPEALKGESGVCCAISQRRSESHVIDGLELSVSDLQACLDETSGELDAERAVVNLQNAGQLGVNMMFRQA